MKDLNSSSQRGERRHRTRVRIARAMRMKSLNAQRVARAQGRGLGQEALGQLLRFPPQAEPA